jgi:predicted RNA-binding Zn-ribbon protein involved in translation (DUF1610 family)
MTAASRDKAVLFCPDCGHESSVAGDWNVRNVTDSRVYECPRCGTTVTNRRQFGLLCSD